MRYHGHYINCNNVITGYSVCEVHPKQYMKLYECGLLYFDYINLYTERWLRTVQKLFGHLGFKDTRTS